MGTMLTSKVTERAQTTLPPAVRTVLGIQPGARIGYVIEGNEVRLVNASAQEHRDPAIEGFLEMLGRDIGRGRVAAIPAPLIEHLQAISKDVFIDHDAPIDGAVAL